MKFKLWALVILSVGLLVVSGLPSRIMRGMGTTCPISPR